MINEEFSNEFDVLYNNITSNQAPGLNEYEKSVFLTMGQNDVLRAYANPRENKVQEGLDGSKKRQIDFSALMKTKVLKKSSTTVKFDNRSISYRMPKDLLLFMNEACQDNKYRYVVIPISYEEYDKLMLKPYQYPIKRGVWRLIVDSYAPGVESVHVGAEGILSIENSSDKEVTFILDTTTVTTDEIDSKGNFIAEAGVGLKPQVTETVDSVIIRCLVDRTLDKTYKYWNRFILGNSSLVEYIGKMEGTETSSFPNVSGTNLEGGISLTAEPCTSLIELIGNTDKDSLTYTLRYLRKPRPIILHDLGRDLSIQGISTESTCELDESIHHEILTRAVELAKAAYTGDLQSQIALGQASKTDIGTVAQSR